MDNSATVELSREDFFKFLDHHKINYQKMDLTKEVVKAEEKKDEKKGKEKQEKAQINLLGV